MSQVICINEIFGPTVQGEGPNAGARCIFVRVQGCDCACEWCDSKHTWGNNSNAVGWKTEDLSALLLELCDSHNCNHIVLTGGNPCLYDFSSIIHSLNEAAIQVDIETQGTVYPGWLAYIDTIVFSPKPPSSGMPDVFDKVTHYISHFMSNDQSIAVKIPIFDDNDLEFARRYAEFVNKVSKSNLKMYLSVGNSNVSETSPIRDRILQSYEELLTKINNNPKHFENVYILPQLHTLVWGNKQGV